MAEGAGRDRSSEFQESDSRLRRDLSFQQLFFISFGSIIGSGWLFATLRAGSVTGPSAIISWIIGAILVIFIALNYAEVSCMIPRSGAVVRYPHMTHGGFLGFIMSWAFMLATVTVTAIEAEAVVTYASGYVKNWTGLELTTTAQNVTILTGVGILLAVVLMGFFFLVNVFGVKFFGTFNQYITWWKLAVPVATFLILFLAFNGSNFTAYGGFAPLGVSNIFNAVAVSGIVFSYFGFRQGLDFGGESQNPQRDIPAATISSVLVAAVIYILLQIGFLGAINWGDAGIKAGDWSGLAASNWGDQPLFAAVSAAGLGALGLIFGSLLLFDAAVSPAGTGWIYMGASTRVLYGMAMHDDLPRPLTRVSNEYRIPWVALVSALVIGSIFFLPLPGWYLLVEFITSATVFTFVMGALQLQVLRRTAPDLERPFWLRGASILSPLGFLSGSMIFYWSGFGSLQGVVPAVLTGLAVYTFFQAPARGRMSRGMGLAIGIPFLVIWLVTQYFGPVGQDSLPFLAYFFLSLAEVLVFIGVVYVVSNAEGKREVNAAWWVIFMTFALFLLAYYGSYNTDIFKDNAPIAFPWDNLIAVAIGLVAYYWGVASGFETEDIKDIKATGSGLVPEAEEEEELNLAT
ncbi:MAG: APC family permease [Rubrobacteraceae bacterium]